MANVEADPVIDAASVAGCARSPPRSRMTRMRPVGVGDEPEMHISVFSGCAKVTQLWTRGGTTAATRSPEYLFYPRSNTLLSSEKTIDVLAKEDERPFLCV